MPSKDRLSIPEFSPAAAAQESAGGVVEAGTLCVVLRRISSDLASSGETPLTIGQVVAELGDSSFGALLLVLGLAAVPTPPVAAAVLGAPLLWVSAQMLMGRRAPWLPAAFTRIGLRPPAAARLIHRLAPGVSRLESMLRSRKPGLFNLLHVRLVALACVLLSGVLLTPVPFAHTAAALAVVAFASGLMQRDGLALLAGWALTAGCVMLLLGMGAALASARLL